MQGVLINLFLCTPNKSLLLKTIIESEGRKIEIDTVYGVKGETKKADHWENVPQNLDNHNLYQSGHAIWCGRSVDKIIIYLLPEH